MFIFLLSGRGRVLFCCCLGGGVGPAQTAKQKKNKTCTRPNSKKMNTPPTLPSVLFFFCCLGGWACFCFAAWAAGIIFDCLGGERDFCFCCLGGACSIFCCLGGGRVFFFAVWARGVCVFLLVGRVSLFFFLLFGRGTGVHPLTGLPGSSLRDPTTKNDQTAKKRYGFPMVRYITRTNP